MTRPSEWATKLARRVGFDMMLSYPDLHLRPIALALDAARAEGFRDGIEAAARVCSDEEEGGRNDQDSSWAACADYCARTIRALIPPMETP